MDLGFQTPERPGGPDPLRETLFEVSVQDLGQAEDGARVILSFFVGCCLKFSKVRPCLGEPRLFSPWRVEEHLFSPLIRLSSPAPCRERLGLDDRSLFFDRKPRSTFRGRPRRIRLLGKDLVFFAVTFLGILLVSAPARRFP